MQRLTGCMRRTRWVLAAAPRSAQATCGQRRGAGSMLPCGPRFAPALPFTLQAAGVQDKAGKDAGGGGGDGRGSTPAEDAPGSTPRRHKRPPVWQLITSNLYTHRERKEQDEDDIMICQVGGCCCCGCLLRHGGGAPPLRRTSCLALHL